MSTEQEQARLIAERVARRVASAASPRSLRGSSANLSDELAAVRASLSDLQQKLAQIEARVSGEGNGGSINYSQTENPVLLTHSPWLAGVNASVSHPSQERFGVEEATVAELVDFFEKEKTCTVEPGGKPCDHCSMCSSRGF
jgi:hypothetical protein